MSTPTPVALNFANIASGQPYLFINADAWNSYFRNVTATLVGANLPAATTDTQGAVKQAVCEGLFFVGLARTYFDVVDTNTNTQSVPTRASFDNLYDQVQALYAQYGKFLDALTNAGIWKAQT